jgi:hypothetical protein
MDTKTKNLIIIAKIQGNISTISCICHACHKQAVRNVGNENCQPKTDRVAKLCHREVQTQKLSQTVTGGKEFQAEPPTQHPARPITCVSVPFCMLLILALALALALGGFVHTHEGTNRVRIEN